jgi:hypothetical protein
MIGLIGAIWGLAGFSLLLIYTIFHLTPIAIEAFSFQFRWYHWLVLVLNTILMAYYEGFRGFQKGFSPRVVARASYLIHHPNVLHSLLGPIFCTGYFYTSKRRKIATIALTIGIIILIFLVRLLDQPWRGIIDLGVVVGLSWGLISLLIFTVQAITSAEFNHSPEVPEEYH